MDTRKKRFSKGKAAVLLSVCVATALCVNFANSCSGDEDYDKYRGDELQTHAAATRSASEDIGPVFFVGVPVMPGSHQDDNVVVADSFIVDFTISWSDGWTGNENSTRSLVSIRQNSHYDGKPVNRICYREGNRKIYTAEYDVYSVISSQGEWLYTNDIRLSFKYLYCHYKDQKYSHKMTKSQQKTFTKTYSYSELGCREDTTLVN